MVLKVLQSKVEDRSLGGIKCSDVIVARASSIEVSLRVLDSGKVNFVDKVHQLLLGTNNNCRGRSILGWGSHIKSLFKKYIIIIYD